MFQVLVAVVVILVGYLLLFKKKSKVLKVPPTPTADEISPYPAKGAIAFRCASALSFKCIPFAALYGPL